MHVPFPFSTIKVNHKTNEIFRLLQASAWFLVKFSSAQKQRLCNQNGIQLPSSSLRTRHDMYTAIKAHTTSCMTTLWVQLLAWLFTSEPEIKSVYQQKWPRGRLKVTPGLKPFVYALHAHITYHITAYFIFSPYRPLIPNGDGCILHLTPPL